MKALFNGVCDGCDTLLPGCAKVRFKTVMTFQRGKLVTLCPGCRKRNLFRGRFVADARHR